MIKLIFYYQVRQKRITFFFISFFENGRKLLRDESKNNRSFSLQKQQKIGENNFLETQDI